MARVNAAYRVVIEAIGENGEPDSAIRPGVYVLEAGQIMELVATGFAVGVNIRRPPEPRVPS